MNHRRPTSTPELVFIVVALAACAAMFLLAVVMW